MLARFLLLAYSIGILVILEGCVSDRSPPLEEHHIDSEFDLDEAKALVADGPNSIDGSGFLRQQGGGVVTCAGEKVQLLPETAYARERMQYIYGSADGGFTRPNRRRIYFSPGPTPKGFEDTIRTSTCDAQGKFQFERIASGNFFLVTCIEWYAGDFLQGGCVMQRVEVRDGVHLRVVLSR